MFHSLRSFLFFAKERNVLLGLISCQKLEKRMEKNGTKCSFFRTEKNVTFRTEKNGVPNPVCTYILLLIYGVNSELEQLFFASIF